MQKQSKIYIAGHTGMVGSAILRNLKLSGYDNFLLRSYDELNLSRQTDVELFFEKERPDYVFLAAAKVGGIIANNTYRAEFIYENLMIQNNVIHSAWKSGVKKLLFLGSSCIYPRNANQPMKEEYMLTGPLEITNEPYAIAKISGIKMCENYFKQYGCNFISVMPTNLYGHNDNYDLEKSHVLPALIRKMHLGKCLYENNWDSIRVDLNRYPIECVDGTSPDKVIIEIFKKYGIVAGTATNSSGPKSVSVSLWGTGSVFREFLHVDDMADACIFIMDKIDAENLYNNINQTHINIGTGKDISIKDLAEKVKNIVGFIGKLIWDSSKPDGTAKKQLDVSLIHNLGWKHSIKLEAGIKAVYNHLYDSK